MVVVGGWSAGEGLRAGALALGLQAWREGADGAGHSIAAGIASGRWDNKPPFRSFQLPLAASPRHRVRPGLCPPRASLYSTVRGQGLNRGVTLVAGAHSLSTHRYGQLFSAARAADPDRPPTAGGGGGGNGAQGSSGSGAAGGSGGGDDASRGGSVSYVLERLPGAQAGGVENVKPLFRVRGCAVGAVLDVTRVRNDV